MDRGPFNRRYAAHVGDEIGVVRAVEGGIPGEGGLVDELPRHDELEPVVHDRPQILELPFVPRPDGRGHRGGDQGILGALVVIGEVDVQPAREQRRLAADLDLARPLRLQIRVADRAVDEARHIREIHVGRFGRKELQRVGGPRMIPRVPDRAPQPQAVQPGPLREERLLGDDP